MSSREKKSRQRSTERNRSTSRTRAKSASKSPSRQKTTSARGGKVYTRKEMSESKTNNNNTDYVRVTRSQTSHESEKQKSIERLKKEITDLTSVDRFLQKSNVLATVEDVKAKAAEVHSIAESLRKRRQRSTSSSSNKENKPAAAAAPATNKKYRFSGYLRYTHSNVFSILLATLLVIVLFVIISRSTLNRASIVDYVRNLTQKFTTSKNAA